MMMINVVSGNIFKRVLRSKVLFFVYEPFKFHLEQIFFQFPMNLAFIIFIVTLVPLDSL